MTTTKRLFKVKLKDDCCTEAPARQVIRCMIRSPSLGIATRLESCRGEEREFETRLNHKTVPETAKVTREAKRQSNGRLQLLLDCHNLESNCGRSRCCSEAGGERGRRCSSANNRAVTGEKYFREGTWERTNRPTIATCSDTA